MIVIAAALIVGACALAAAQVLTFKRANAPAAADGEFFSFTAQRLRIRLGGAAVLAAIGITLLAWEIGAPLSPENAQRVVTLFIGEVVLLFVVAFLDLRETARAHRR